MTSRKSGTASPGRTVCLVAALLPIVAGPLKGAIVEAFGATPGAKCAAAKIKAAGKKVYAKARCYQRAILAETSVEPECLAKMEDKFTAAVGKAELLGPCPGTANDLEAIVDDCVEALTAAIATTTTSTTTTTPTTTTTLTTNVVTCCETSSACAVLSVSDCSIFSARATPGPAGSWCDAYTGRCVTAANGDLGFCCQPAISSILCVSGFCDGEMRFGVCTESGCIDPRS